VTFLLCQQCPPYCFVCSEVGFAVEPMVCLRAFLVVLSVLAASGFRVNHNKTARSLNADTPAQIRAASVADGGAASSAVALADPLIASGDMTAAIAAFEAKGVNVALADELGDLLSAQHGKTKLSVYRNPVASIKGEPVMPTTLKTHGYHGNHAKPEEVFVHGFPAKGPNLDLETHVKAGGGRAFRGTAPFACAPDGESGPCYFADEGGFVYEIDGVAGWDVNSLLAGRIHNGIQGYGGNPFTSEVEIAILGHVPASRIKGAFAVRKYRGLRLIPGTYTKNPNYEPLMAS